MAIAVSLTQEGTVPDGSLHVLVVDDSAVVRQALTMILSRQRDMVVTTAPDPVVALERMERTQPDVMVLDLEMPRMDGLTFLRQLRLRRVGVPVVVCSALVGPGAEAAIRALQEGAVDLVAKPQLGVRDYLHDAAPALVDTIRAAAAARVLPSRIAQGGTPHPGPLPRSRAQSGGLPRVTADTVVAVGASTGGVEALTVLLQGMPLDGPGLVVVQHMPEGFTAAFATRLNSLCRIEVKEAAPGDRVTPGRALIARGNHHLRLARSGARYLVDIRDGPPVGRHRPSVDALFDSVATEAGPNAIGVLLTGMGSDGADGLCRMKRAGAATIAQNEETCVVFGMPREAIVRGAVDDVLPLERICGRVLDYARGRIGPGRAVVAG